MPCNLISSCFFLESPWSRDQVMQEGPRTIQRGSRHHTRMSRHQVIQGGGSRDQVIQGSGTIQGVQSQDYTGGGSRDQVIQGSGTIQGSRNHTGGSGTIKEGPGTR